MDTTSPGNFNLLDIFPFTIGAPRSIRVLVGDYRLLPADAAILFYNQSWPHEENSFTHRLLTEKVGRYFHVGLDNYRFIVDEKNAHTHGIFAPPETGVLPVGFRAVIFALHVEKCPLGTILLASLIRASSENFTHIVIPAPRLIHRPGNPEFAAGDWATAMKYALKDFFTKNPYTTLQTISLVFVNSASPKASNFIVRMQNFMKERPAEPTENST